MKKILIVTAVLTMLVSSFTACGKQPANNASSSQSDTEEVKTLEGTLSEKKDFMYIITDAEDNAYVFAIDEEHPADLTGIEAGDKITMTYKGTLDLTDNFTGEVLSIKKS